MSIETAVSSPGIEPAIFRLIHRASTNYISTTISNCNFERKSKYIYNIYIYIYRRLNSDILWILVFEIVSLSTPEFLRATYCLLPMTCLSHEVTLLIAMCDASFGMWAHSNRRFIKFLFRVVTISLQVTSSSHLSCSLRFEGTVLCMQMKQCKVPHVVFSFVSGKCLSLHCSGYHWYQALASHIHLLQLDSSRLQVCGFTSVSELPTEQTSQSVLRTRHLV
jgi:hypothetical protein